ncbi:Alpha-protein kinase vwkA [Vanrija pseudolonga]|uniref:Alpha-protein kinase vwkA n=1 Tax=Vanrija pseudolonga TaxID=143232 RepID=A0AAF0Y1B7_9TREE|nr:Alpha-protein kinase vwkA [Vanrija pseudolonga]
MDDDMYDDSSSGYSAYSSYYAAYPPRSPPPTPPRPEPVVNYNVRYIESDGLRMRKCIDLVFVLDCTGSMQRYINSVRDHIFAICDLIRGEEGLNGADDLRVAIVNYRDHKPQDNTYVYKFHPFTSNIVDVQGYLRGLTAAGGGDGPEAVTAAMAACLTELEWRREAARMVVLIADAPPHGIGESGDQIKQGDPDGHDPLVIARTMAQHGITFFMVACEDTLSNYSRAVDFFTAICNMTSGVMMPLTTADLLAMTIVGSVLENMDMERLISEIGREVAERIKEKGENLQSVEEVAQELHERLLLRNEQTKQVQLQDVYIQSDSSRKNVSMWMNAQYIHEVAPLILPVSGRRLTDKFRKNNYNSGFKYTPGGRLPPRRTSATAGVAPPTPGTPPTDLAVGSPPRLGTSPSSPPRKIVSDFKVFGAAPAAGSAPSLSVFGAPMLATGPGGGMFGATARTPASNTAMRGFRGGEDDDDDDDEDSGTQFRQAAISLDQARRIATQSVFRAGRLPI